MIYVSVCVFVKVCAHVVLDLCCLSIVLLDFFQNWFVVCVATVSPYRVCTMWCWHVQFIGLTPAFMLILCSQYVSVGVYGG